jgi:hypothetical protein
MVSRHSGHDFNISLADSAFDGRLDSGDGRTKLFETAVSHDVGFNTGIRSARPLRRRRPA